MSNYQIDPQTGATRSKFTTPNSVALKDSPYKDLQRTTMRGLQRIEMQVPSSNGARLVAALIDGALTSIFAAITYALLPWQSMPLQSAIAYCWVVGFTCWGYFAGMESSNFQATPGKMIMGLKVTDLDGGSISFARATGRYFSKTLSALPLYAGYLMILFTVRNQGLHDKIAKTQVVRCR